MSILSRPEFHDEQAAYDYIEARLWANGPVCPHCGGVERISKMGGKSTRIGTYKCYQCRKPFTVKVGTIFESSHVKMHIWLQAIYLMCASKKGISSNQLHRTLGVTLKTAWFMSHRIREAMRSGALAPMGGGGGAVEVDETYIGRDASTPKGRHIKPNRDQKQKLLALVDRETGEARTFVVKRVRAAELAPILNENIARETRLMTDQARFYQPLSGNFDSHEVVNHQKKEYVRGDVTTNTVEGFFSIFKRGMKGVYQHCDEKNLHRYAAEYAFRYSNRIAKGVDDAVRADIALKGVVGKRLSYKSA